MQLTLHATRPTPHGASRLVQATCAWSVKPGALDPGIVGMRGSIVTHDYGHAWHEYTRKIRNERPNVGGVLYQE